MMYLKIPNPVFDFTLLKLAEHVLDNSPAITSRNVMRLVSRAVDAIATAETDVVGMPDDVAKAFQVAADAAPPPELGAYTKGEDGKPTGEPQRIPPRAYEKLYAAIEGMTAERPEPTVAPAPAPAPAPEPTEAPADPTAPLLESSEAVAAE
jgi:hypothetical protein